MDGFVKLAGMWCRDPRENKLKKVFLCGVGICYLQEVGSGKRGRKII